MSNFLTVFILFTIALFGASSTHAQSAAQLQAQLGDPKLKKQSSWSGTLSSTTLSSMKELSAYSSTLNTSLSGSLRYKTPYFNMRLFVAGDKDLNGARQDRFSSTYLEISNKVSFLSTKEITTLFQGRLNAPVNDELRREDSYRGGLSAGFLFIIKLPDPQYQLIVITRATKNIHEFKIDRNYNKNTSVNNINSVIWSYYPAKDWELSLYASIVNSWNYQGGINDNYYSAGQSLSYMTNYGFDFTVGHEIGGYTYGYYGNNFDLSLLDSNSSIFYGTVTYNF